MKKRLFSFFLICLIISLFSILLVACNNSDVNQNDNVIDNTDSGGSDVNEKVASEGLEYTLVGGSYQITNYYGDDKDVVIPQVYNNIPVTSIGSQAFLEGYYIKTVTIPDSITVIEDEAFYNTDLVSIVIPKSVIIIGESIFRGCLDIKSVIVDKDNPIYHSDGNCIIETQSKTIVNAISKSIIPIDESVESIAAKAFIESYGLTSIVIPNNIKRIDEDAFDGCYKLVEVCNLSSLNIEKGSEDNGKVGLYAKDIYTTNNFTSKLRKDKDFVIYDDGIKTSLIHYDGNNTNITLPLVDEINDYALAFKYYIKSITIPEGVKKIGPAAFICNYGITKMIIPNSVETIDEVAFLGCIGLCSVTIGNGVKGIENWAFDQCSKLYEICNLSSLNIEQNSADNGSIALFAKDIYTTTDYTSKLSFNEKYIAYMDEGENTLLSYLGNEKDVVTPEGITIIGLCAFRECDSLESVIISEGVDTIYNSAFSRCKKLKSIKIPASAINLPDILLNPLSIIYNCMNLETIIVDDNNSVYHSDGNCIINTENKALILGCKTSVVPTDGSVENIIEEAFSNVVGLTNIVLPNTITCIGRSAFYGTGLTNIVIPESVTTMGNNVFQDCNNLKTIYCEASSKPEGWDANWLDNCTATVVWGYAGE